MKMILNHLNLFDLFTFPLILRREKCRDTVAAPHTGQGVPGSATYRSGCSQEHPNLKKIKKKKFIFNPY